MKILIVTDKYYPKALANAICAQSIAKSFIEAGHQVDILAYKDTGIEMPTSYENIPVYSVQPDIRLRLFYYSNNFPKRKMALFAKKTATLLNRTNKLFLSYWSPLYGLSFPRRILKKMEELYNLNGYAIVISVYEKFENALSGMWFKNKHPECNWCLYALDTFKKQNHSYLPKRMRNACYWLLRFVKSADLFLYMITNKLDFSDESFEIWKYKMRETDIPLLSRKEVRCFVSENKNKTERWIYAGAIEKTYYNINDAVTCFLKLPCDKRRELHFYCNEGSEKRKLRELEEKTEGKIKCHDYVEHDLLDKIYKEADVLVSIKSSNLISAKIFEYMTYGKKIVHFSGIKDDPNARYVEKYSKGIVIRTYNKKIDDCVSELKNKLDGWNIRTNDEPVNLSMFKMNTPEYTRDLIISYFTMEGKSEKRI